MDEQNAISSLRDEILKKDITLQSESGLNGLVRENVVAKDVAKIANSEDASKDRNEKDQPVNREPPSFGTFTKFTIEQILSSKQKCQTNNYDVDKNSSGNTQKLSISKRTIRWINENSTKSLTGSKSYTYEGETFLMSSYAADHCPESPTSSESDEILAVPDLHSDNSGTTESIQSSQASPDTDHQSEYSWLHCTRYKPPKLPRSRRKEGIKRRKLGRNPRVPFTQHQVACLEQKFLQMRYLSSVDVAQLADALCISEDRVKIWFQNRRARERRDKESGQADQNISRNQQSNYCLHGAKSVKETFLSEGTRSLPSLDQMSHDKYPFKVIPEATKSTLQMYKSPQQMSAPVPSYLLHRLLPSRLPWLRPIENPFQTQGALDHLNR